MDHGDLGSTGEPVAMDTGGLLGFFLASGSSAPVGIKCGGSIVAWIVRRLDLLALIKAMIGIHMGTENTGKGHQERLARSLDGST